MTDPAFGAGAVALSAAPGAPGAGLLAAGDEHAVGQAVERGVARGSGMNPPSSAISVSVMFRCLSSSAVSGSSVSSAGFPSLVVGGRINPRAPRCVFSVISPS